MKRSYTLTELSFRTRSRSLLKDLVNNDIVLYRKVLRKEEYRSLSKHYWKQVYLNMFLSKDSSGQEHRSLSKYFCEQGYSPYPKYICVHAHTYANQIIQKHWRIFSLHDCSSTNAMYE